MYQIYYRIRDRYSKNIVALAVFTDNTEMENTIEEQLYGTKLSFEFNSFYIKDQNQASLLASDNPFALAILASLYALKTKGASRARQRVVFKEELFRLFLSNDYKIEDVYTMLVFLDQILKLPIELELIFNNKLNAMNQEKEFGLEGTKRVLKEHADRLFKLAYEKDIEEVMKRDAILEAEKVKLKAEKAKLKVEKTKSNAKLKAEKEKLKVEKTKSNAEKEKLKVEKIKSDAKLKKTISLLYKSGITITQIAENTDIKIQEIEHILKSEKLI